MAPWATDLIIWCMGIYAVLVLIYAFIRKTWKAFIINLVLLSLVFLVLTLTRDFPDKSTSFYQRENSHDNKDDYDAAIADYTRAIEIDPNFALAYNNRGNAYRRIGNDDAAEADAAMYRKLKAEGH